MGSFRTRAPPVKGKMLKGLCVCYAVVTVTFFSVAISGSWAFGNQSEGLILSNNGIPLVPKWFILMTNIFTILQLSAVGVVLLYLTCGFLQTFKPSKRSPIFWLNITIAVVFSIMAVIAAVAAVRQKSQDASTYKLFANV